MNRLVSGSRSRNLRVKEELAQDRRSRRSMLRAIDGFVLRPNPTPPPIRQAPWNTIVVTLIASTPTETPFQLSYSVNAVWSEASIQLGLNTVTLQAELRFQRVEVWATSTEPTVAIALAPHDIAGDATTNTRVFARLEDHCGKNQWARCGFQWPRSIQNTVVESASQQPVAVVRSSVGATNAYIRFHILWRGTNPSVPTWTIADDARVDWCEPRPTGYGVPVSSNKGVGPPTQ